MSVYKIISIIIIFVIIIFIIIFIFTINKRGRKCIAGSDRFTPYQSEDLIPTIPTYRKKEGKGKTVQDKKGESSLGQ